MKANESKLYYYALGNLRYEYFGGIVYNEHGVLLRVNKEEALFYENVINNSIETFSDKYDVQLYHNILIKFIQANLITVSKFPNAEFTNKRRVIYSNHTPKYLQAPISVHLYPTYKCNQSCLFCYKPEIEDVNFNLANEKNILTLINTLIEKGVIILNLLGGEPLLYFDTLIKIIDRAYPFMFCSVASNGSANRGFDDKVINQLKKYPRLNIKVSLHDLNEDTHDAIVQYKGAFQKSINSINKLVRNGFYITVNCLPNTINSFHIKEFVDFCYNIGVKEFYLLPVHNTTKYHDGSPFWLDWKIRKKIIIELKELKNEYAKKGFIINFLDWFDRLESINFNNPNELEIPMCAAGHEILEIDPDGNTYPCHMCLGKDEFVTGNAFFENFDDVWNTSKYAIFRHEEYKAKDKNCLECRYYNLCKGGCPLQRYLFSGGLNNSVIGCPIIQLN